MIQIVVKRDGRVVGFNEEKIKAAIRKAMLQTEKGEDESLIQKITDRIVMKGNERMTVEDSGFGRNRAYGQPKKGSRKKIYCLSRPA